MSQALCEAVVGGIPRLGLHFLCCREAGHDGEHRAFNPLNLWRAAATEPQEERMALVFDLYVIQNNPVGPGMAQDKSITLVGTFDTYEEARENQQQWQGMLEVIFKHFRENKLPRGWSPFAAGTTLGPREVPEG